MRKIFATFFLAAALPALLGAPPALSGEADPGVKERFDELLPALAALFRVSWRNSATPLTLMFSPAVPENSAELGCGGGRWVLMLNGSPGRWDEDFGLRRKLFSALLLAAADARLVPGESRALPPWVVAAATRRLAVRKVEERLIGGNHRAPVLRALLEKDELPKVEVVVSADPERLTPAAEAWEEELADALYMAAGKRIASPDYLKFCAENACRRRPAAETDRFWMRDKLQEPQERFAESARRLAWHELNPRPARRTIALLAAKRRVSMPLLDENGEPVPDKFLECDITELAEKLRGRPDAERIASGAKYAIRELGSGDSRRVKKACAQLAELVGYAVDPPFRYASRLCAALETLEAELARREKLGKWLDEADLRRAPVRRHFRNRLRSAEFLRRGESLLPEAAREYLDRREVRR